MKNENLAKLRVRIAEMPDDQQAESFVRDFLSRVAKSCPMVVLKHLAETVASCRSDELHAEAERN